MAQLVGCRRLITEARVLSQQIYVKFVGDKAALKFFSENFLPHVDIIPPMLHTHSNTYQ
jgi:hypothetical protein